MNTARTKLIAEIGPLPGVVLDVLPVLVIGPMGNGCTACDADGPAMVTLHWAKVMRNAVVDCTEVLHRDCAPRRVRAVAEYADGEITVELGCYPTDVTEAWNADHDDTED